MDKPWAADFANRTIAPGFTVRLGGTLPEPSAATLAKVDELWTAEKRQRGDAVFDGQLFCIAEFSTDELLGQFVSYRRIEAQAAEPQLYDQLQLRPLGVNALLACRDGLVFAQRSELVTQDRGRWELAPSGGISDAYLRANDTIDYQAELSAELLEELNVQPEALSRITPFALVYSPDSGVYDVGVELRTELSGSQLQAIFEQVKKERWEYQQLKIVAPELLDAFVRDHSPGPTSLALLRLRGLLK